jgi:DNA-binding winged helix-turn-helix (wHTH) protein
MDSPAYRYRFGTAEFDESRLELRVAGLPIEVERRALEVLAYLLKHAGEVVTKEELLREVWAGRVTVDKVLPNAINKLRRALGEANAPCIATQARVGYRLDGTVTRTAVGRQAASHLELSAGQAMPGRANFVLQKQLGRSAGNEVWLAEHAKTRERRVYKFALDADRLRGLKREVTLLRVLQDGLEDASHVAEVIDWNFESSPYFLECKYGGRDLSDWADEHLPSLDRPQRIGLFLQIADAVTAAHAVGVLHKDLKPANVLVSGDAMRPHVRLSDFGSGHLLEPDRLAQLGITRMGMTVEDGAGADSGTPLYLAPELFAGQAPTVKSDVYALGILLYQLLSGRMGQPMAPGWEQEIDDEHLREDLQMATDGNPDRRLGSAGELARRLHQLEQRRADSAEQRSAQEAARSMRESLARSRARRPFVYALVGMLALGIVFFAWLRQQAVDSSSRAHAELQRANALTRFLNEELIGRSNPLVSAKGPDATLREVLLAARDRVPERFSAQPETAAAIHGSLALMFSAIDLMQDSEAEARLALEHAQRHGGAGSEAAFQARSVLVRILSRMSRFDDAKVQLDELEKLSLRAPGPRARQWLAAARSTWHVAQSQFDKAVVELRTAIEGLRQHEPDNTAPRDTLRLDLISALSYAGHREEALAEGDQLVEEVRSRKGDNELLIALARLAQARSLSQQDLRAAERLLLDVQPVIVAHLGENHTRHLQLLGDLLGVAFRGGDWSRAIDYAQKVHERVRAKLGDGHVMTHVTMVNWARTLHEAGQPKSALAKARTSHEQILRMAGPASPRTHDAAFVLALIELDLGDVQRAQPLIDGLDPSALESARATGQWVDSVNALRGIALHLRRDSEKAKSLLDSALKALEPKGASARPDRLYLLAQQARKRLP